MSAQNVSTQSDAGEAIQVTSSPSIFAQETLFYTTDTEYIKNRAEGKTGEGRQKGYLLLYVIDRHGTLEYKGNVYPLAPHNVILIDCARPYRCLPAEESGWEILSCFFNGISAPGYSKYISDHSSRPVFSIDNRKTVLSLFWQVHSLHGKNADYSEILISMNITRILTEICMFHLSEPVQSAEYPDVINCVFYHLNNYYMQKITLDGLAEKFFVNKHYLMREFKRCAGKTVMQYLTEVRIAKAKNLLRYSAKSIEEIAAETGFCHATHLIRTFRKTEQVTPLFYRKQWTL